MTIYTGIGSRKTPPFMCWVMTKLAQDLCAKQALLRSGGAGGADTAFEDGADWRKEVYLPWKGFNGNESKLYIGSGELLDGAIYWFCPCVW